MHGRTSSDSPVVYLAILADGLGSGAVTLLGLLEAHDVSQLGPGQLPVLMLRLQTVTHTFT